MEFWIFFCGLMFCASLILFPAVLGVGMLNYRLWQKGQYEQFKRNMNRYKD